MPPELLDAVAGELGRHRGAGVAASARRLSERYLADHPASRPILAAPDDVAGYLTTRMPATFAAVAAALDQVSDAVPTLEPRSVLDLGAGTGAATWAAREVFGSLERATLVDYAPEALAVAARLLRASDLDVTTTTAPLTRAGSGADDGVAGPDLAVCAFVLGELTEQARDAVVDSAMLAPTVLLVEPGTPAGYRRILRARGRLLDAGWHLAAPCPHELACPLASVEGEWCHAAVRLPRTREHRAAKGGERGYEDEKFSYVAATRLPVRLPAARVLRHPQVRTGHVRLELCEADGAARGVTVSKRQGTLYRAARKAAWGDAWDPA
ncbi:small ribosomal subunit Rsm22 family protein [Beutenbergia cavernae]|nr:small ribosomal subunit Rsm22 family protein [Beutenbergia cavernae]